MYELEIESTENKGIVENFKDVYGIPQSYELPVDTSRALTKLSGRLTGKIEGTPVIRPLYDNSPKEDDVSKWKRDFKSLFNQKDVAERIANKITDGLQRIDQDKFEDSLMEAYSRARERLAQLDRTKTKILRNHGYEDGSEFWTENLCREAYPQDEWFDSEVLDYPAIKKEEHRPQIDTVVMFDDASYSGSLIDSNIRNSNEFWGTTEFFIIVPYITNAANEKILKLEEELGVKINLFTDKIMPTASEILGAEDFNSLREISRLYKINKEQALTYFAHKVPDFRSLLPFVSDTRHMEEQRRLANLIPTSNGVYSNRYFSDLKSKLSI